jgi:putative ABC transport system permease protein
MIRPADRLAVSFGALAVNRLRSALTTLGIVIGVAAVLALVSIGEGAQQKVTERIRSLGTNLIIVTPRVDAGYRTSAELGPRASVTEADAAAIKREVPGVEAAAPLVSGRVLAVNRHLNRATPVIGSTSDILDVRDRGIEQGRSFTPAEVRSGARVALIGTTAAKQLFGDGVDVVDRFIRLGRTPFTIIGLVESKGQSTTGQDQDDVVIVPITTATRHLAGFDRQTAGSADAIFVKFAAETDQDEMQDAIRALLRQRHALRATDRDNFFVHDLTEILAAQTEITDALILFLAAIAFLSLIVGGIGIMNIMLVSVTERTREIGLRMAVGARQGDILLQFLLEAVTLCLAGGIIGLVVGLLIAYFVASAAGFPVVVSPAATAAALGSSAATGIFFGFYPARRAARLDPVVALRYE